MTVATLEVNGRSEKVSQIAELEKRVEALESELKETKALLQYLSGFVKGVMSNHSD